MNFKTLFLIAGLLPALMLGPTGCETMQQHKVISGAAIGTAAGALAGGVIGHQTGHTGAGAAIGAIAGGALGTGVGYYLDRQAKKFQQIQEVEVERIPAREEPQSGRVEPEHLTLRMSNQVLFPRGSSALSPQGTDKMREIARILNEYGESEVLIKGYTSAEGNDRQNTELSERRAAIVKKTLVGYGVAPERIRAMGMGESNPIADNATEAGRQENRRVEIEVFPTAGARSQGGGSQNRAPRYEEEPLNGSNE